jgi:hypothetical protein
MKPSKSYSSPRARWSIMVFSAASMSLVRAICSGVVLEMASDSWLNCAFSSSWRNRSSSSSNRSLASPEAKSYSESDRTCPARSGGRRSRARRRSAMASPTMSCRRRSPDCWAASSSRSISARSWLTTSRSSWAMSS